MSTRLSGSQEDLQSSQPGILRAANGPPNLPKTSLPKTLSAGMGTKNFISEIVDIFAELDRDRKQELINYSNQLADAQRAEKSLLAL